MRVSSPRPKDFFARIHCDRFQLVVDNYRSKERDVECGEPEIRGCRCNPLLGVYGGWERHWRAENRYPATLWASKEALRLDGKVKGAFQLVMGGLYGRKTIAY